MTWIASFVVGFLIVRAVVVAINFFSRPWLKEMPGPPGPEVSVLIPARNEEKNLPGLLADLLRQDLPDGGIREILVYDDQSTDQTGRVVRDFARQDPRISLINGNGVKDGWLGKNHACHALAMQAGGDFLLFLDADVSLSPGLIRNATGYADRHSLDLLSIFPDQIMDSAGEKATVPIMNWILLTLLPLPLIKKSRMPAFAAANGQFMLFKTTVYHQHRFHSLVRNNPVEDIHIMKKMKKLRCRTATLLGGGMIRCRMYQGFQEAVHGFSKNVLDFFGRNYAALTLYTLTTTFGIFIVGLQWNWHFAGAYLLLIMLMKILVSLASRQSIRMNLLYALPQHLSFLAILCRAFYNRLMNSYEWKGRKIRVR